MAGDLAPDNFRLGQTAIAKFAASHCTFIRVQHFDARLLQPLQIALGRFVFPHADIHRRCDHHRLVSRKDQRCRQIIRDPGGHFRHQIGRRGANHNQISFAAELDMPHLGFVLEVPKRGVDFVLAQCSQRHRRHELLSALRQNASDIAPALADQTNKLA